MDVPRPEPDPVHGGQVPDRVRDVGVLHELGLSGGARGEVEHQGVVRVRGAVGLEDGIGGCRLLVRLPAGAAAADRDTGVVAGHLVELRGVLGPDDDVPHPAAFDPVGQVGGAEQRGGRDDDGAQFHRGQRRLPQLDLVAEHDEDAVLGPHAPVPQPVGHPVGALGHRGEGDLDTPAVLLHDVQGGAVVVPRDGVEPVEGPVEVLRAGPAEPLVGRGVVRAVLQQEVPRGTERVRPARCRRHVSSSLPDRRLPSCIP